MTTMHKTVVLAGKDLMKVSTMFNIGPYDSLTLKYSAASRRDLVSPMFAAMPSNRFY